MRRLSSVRWRTPSPTSVDEELAVYDDGSVWLVVRSSRDGSATIGTWSTTPGVDDHVGLVATGDIDVDLLHPTEIPAVVERLRTAAIASPVATARFVAGRGGDGAVTLVAIGDGFRPVELELDPHAISVHLERDGATAAWFESAPPETGFITPDAVGLGGLHRRAVIPPGVVGAILLDVPGIGADADGEVAVEVAGWLADGLPDQLLPVPFRVRTVPSDVARP